MFPTEMECYSCHAQHTAVDTTFVQFYPTLIEIAKKKGTLSAAYLKEEPVSEVRGSEQVGSTGFSRCSVGYWVHRQKPVLQGAREFV